MPTGAPCRRDEGVPPYRSGVAPAKNSAYADKILAGGQGTPLPYSIETNKPYNPSRNVPRYRHPERSAKRAVVRISRERIRLPLNGTTRILARSCLFTGGRGTHLPRSTIVSTGIADLPAGAPCRANFFVRQKIPSPPLSRDKFRCSARQTRRKPPDSTIGTADGLRPKFNTAERENYSAKVKLILPSANTPATLIRRRSPKRKV